MEPLLSPEEVFRIIEEHSALPANRDMGAKNLRWAIERTRAFYEDLRKKGELVSARDLIAELVRRRDQSTGEARSAFVSMIMFVGTTDPPPIQQEP